MRLVSYIFKKGNIFIKLENTKNMEKKAPSPPPPLEAWREGTRNKKAPRIWRRSTPLSPSPEDSGKESRKHKKYGEAFPPPPFGSIKERKKERGLFYKWYSWKQKFTGNNKIILFVLLIMHFIELVLQVDNWRMW